MNVPGAIARHAIITDNCREAQGGDLAAFEEAVNRLRVSYQEIVQGWPRGAGAQLHVVLTVERPPSAG